jgi:nicotinamidase-related amidase|tara:strand:+ start:586 stop:1101 length:516 start_codon:yes stop_codon:yes gene_type:complete
MKTLLLVDWQNNDYQNSDKAHSGAAVINGSYLLEQWRKKGFNVVHVLTDCVKIWKSNQWRKQRFKSESPIVDNTILREFTPLDDETLLWKPDRSAFFNTNLEETLTPGQQIYCTGAATTGCVLATAIHGDALGYEMHFVEDCIFDKDQQRHDRGMDILPKFGRVVHSKDIV